MKESEFISLILPLKDRLFRIAWHIVRSREEAEDIVQEVMMKVWNMELSEVGNREAYCYTMSRNLALNRLALKENRNVSLAPGCDGEMYVEPFDRLVQTERLEVLHQMMSRLSGVQRDVMQLRDVEGMNYAEIAETLRLTEEQVKVYLFRARKKVKEFCLKLENYGLENV